MADWELVTYGRSIKKCRVRKVGQASSLSIQKMTGWKPTPLIVRTIPSKLSSMTLGDCPPAILLAPPSASLPDLSNRQKRHTRPTVSEKQTTDRQ
jgi:hypothetical protein